MTTVTTFPQTRLVSVRVVLRAFGPADVREVWRTCSDELVQRWTSVPSPYTDEHARAWCLTIAPQLRESGDGIAFAVVDPLTDRFLGSIDLKNTNWWTRVTEVGYLAAPWARGRGLIAESVRLLAVWLFDDQAFQRLELRAATDNHASRRVAEKAGFLFEGVLRNAGLINAGRVDHAIYSLVPGDLR